jgi:type IX secretion system PorP/SprF family membrane protein
MLQMNRFWLTALVVFVLGLKCFAQQDAQYSHQYFLPTLLNPAHVGNNDALVAGADFRVQWLGQPITQALYFAMPVSKIKGSAGAYITNDFAGAHRATSLAIQYAFQKKVNGIIIKAGAELGLIQYSLNGNILRSPDGNYQNGIDHNDNKLPLVNSNAISPDLGLGANATFKKISAGLGIKHIITTPLQFSSPSGDVGKIKYSPTVYFNANYNFVAGQNLIVRPVVLIKSDLRKTTTDLNLIANYKQQYLLGLNFRGYNKASFDALSLLLGYQISETFFMVYSYDLTLTKLIRASTGSHEISIHYKMKPPKPLVRGKIVYCPRFL